MTNDKDNKQDGYATIQVECTKQSTAIKMEGSPAGMCVGALQVVEGLLSNLKDTHYQEKLLNKLEELVEEYKERA